MARIDVHDDQVRVRLSPLEKVFALRGGVTFPRDAITSVERAEEGLGAVQGVRAPGLGLPGRVKIGTWRRRGGKELVVARRGRPALRIELRGQPFAAVVVDAENLDEAADALT